MFCRECGKQIEEGARFCRFCGKAQADPGSPAATTTASSSSSSTGRSAAGPGVEGRLRQLFPRHHLQDEFMHIASIVAFFTAVIGFVLGLFVAVLLGMLWLLFAIALILFLILRESTLSHVRGGRGAGSATASTAAGRYHAGRGNASDHPGAAAEGATAESSPPAIK